MRSAEPIQGLRIVRILTRFNVGGPARQVLALQEEMANLGATTVLVGGRVQEGEADLAELSSNDEVVRIPMLGRRLSPIDDLRAVASLVALIRKVRPHVVHTHMAKAGALGRVAAVSARVPLRVHTFHGHTLGAYWGKAATRTVVEAERGLARISTALVAVSEQVRSELLARGIGKPDRFFAIEAGLDLAPFLAVPRDGKPSRVRQKLGIPEKSRVIVFAGRLVPVKGVGVLLESVLPMLEDHTDLHLLVAGDGPEMALIRRAQSTPRGQRIHTLGWRMDMPEVYGAADLVLLTSLNEGTPLSLIEAAATGLPAVAADVGGVSEVVRDGRTGFLTPAGQPLPVRAAIDRILRSPEAAARMGAEGRREVARFTSARLARDLFTLYGDLWNSRR